eukprot:m.428923 g.428923  ORF g.428923 m.428923 type:complete len:171 (-) comp16912_c0_seq1:1733-2245(-)
MPPKKAKKGSAPVVETLSIVVYVKASPGQPPIEPIVSTLPPTASLAKAKTLIDKAVCVEIGVPRGSVLFSSWKYIVTSPPYTKPTRQLSTLNTARVYDTMWVSTLGAAPSSSIVLEYGSDRRIKTVVWYLDIPELPAPRSKLSPSERAAKDIAKHKLAMAAAAGGKKKKK